MLPAESDGKLDRAGYIGCRRIADTAKNRALNILADPSLLQILDLQRLSIRPDVFSRKCVQAEPAVRIGSSISVQTDRQNVEIVIGVVEQEVRPVEDIEHIHLEFQPHLFMAWNDPEGLDEREVEPVVR